MQSNNAKQKIKEIYVRYLEEYCYDQALSKLPKTFKDLQYRKHLCFEALFQHISVKKSPDYFDIEQSIKNILANGSISENTTSKRNVIFGEPGQGKSFLVNRIALALLHKENDLLSKYTDIVDAEAFPVFIALSDIHKMPNEQILIFQLTLATIDAMNDTSEEWVAKFLYALTCCAFPNGFKNEVSEDDFIQLLSNEKKVFIFDGFDELLDDSLQALILSTIKIMPQEDVILTSRTVDKERFDNYKGLEKCYIGKIEEKDVPIFAKNLFSAIYGDSYKDEYTEVVEQLKKPYFSTYLTLLKNPLSFSMLISSALVDFSLPENKALLYEKYIDQKLSLYKSKDDEDSLGDEIKQFLCYIAFYLLNNRNTSLEFEELLLCIDECCKTVSFQKKISEDRIKEIPNQLLKSGFMYNPFGLGVYGFENSSGSYNPFNPLSSGNYSFNKEHKQILEVLAAKALLAGWVDLETRRYNTVDFLVGKADDSRWREVLILYALMTNEYELKEIIDKLIDGLKNETIKSANEVLFSLVYENANRMGLNYKKKIFSAIFTNSISQRQFEMVIELFEVKNENAKLLIDFIKEEAIASFERKDEMFQYGYAYGMVEISRLIIDKEIDPFCEVERIFLNSDSLVEIYLASQSLVVLSWYLYAGLKFNKKLNDCIANRQLIKMSRECHCRIRDLLMNETDERMFVELSLMFRESALFFWNLKDSELFSDDFFAFLINRLDEQEKDKKYFGIFLSAFPLYKLPDVCLVSDPIKEKILRWLENEIKERDVEELIYRFRIAAITGAITKGDLSDCLKRTMLVYFNNMEDLDSYGPIHMYCKDTFEAIRNRHDIE